MIYGFDYETEGVDSFPFIRKSSWEVHFVYPWGLTAEQYEFVRDLPLRIIEPKKLVSESNPFIKFRKKWDEYERRRLLATYNLSALVHDIFHPIPVPIHIDIRPMIKKPRFKNI